MKEANDFYGHISKNEDLPVTGDWILRANHKNHRFARNTD